MITTSASTAELIRDLTVKVKNGSLSKEEATKLAITALQEVAEQEQTLEAPTTEEKKEEEPAPKAKTIVIDPKTKILSLLTQFEEAVQGSLKRIERDITTIIQGTEGAAVPLGDFSIGSDSASAKVTVEAGDKPAQVMVTYNLKRQWNVEGINLPVQASVAKSCHLPLRQDLLNLCSEIKETTGSELAWKRNNKLPLEQIASLEATAKAVGDVKAVEIIEGRPTNEQAESWKKWAVAGQIYLLGSDYSKDKKFSVIKQGL